MLLILHTNAQKKNYTIKLYNLTTIEQNSVSNYKQSLLTSTVKNNVLNLLHPTIGLQWNNRKYRMREIELTNFSIRHLDNSTRTYLDSTQQTFSTGGNKNLLVNIGIRLEQMFVITKDENSKFQAILGYGFNPYYIKNHTVPMVSSSYPADVTNLGVRAFFIPRMTYKLSSRCVFDANIPICFGNAYVESSKQNNPTSTQQMQSSTTYNFEFLPRFFSGRIGIGIRL